MYLSVCTKAQSWKFAFPMTIDFYNLKNVVMADAITSSRIQYALLNYHHLNSSIHFACPSGTILRAKRSTLPYA